MQARSVAVRDVTVERRTIARQRAEPADLASGLEPRVQAQVEEIVARASEVDRLNTELREQVRARSAELSGACRAPNVSMVGRVVPNDAVGHLLR